MGKCFIYTYFIYIIIFSFYFLTTLFIILIYFILLQLHFNFESHQLHSKTFKKKNHLKNLSRLLLRYLECHFRARVIWKIVVNTIFKFCVNCFFSTRLLQDDRFWINNIPGVSPALGFWSPGSPCRRPEGRHSLTGRWIWKNYIHPHWGSWWEEWRYKTAQKKPARRTRACIYCTCSLSQTPALWSHWCGWLCLWRTGSGPHLWL